MGEWPWMPVFESVTCELLVSSPNPQWSAGFQRADLHNGWRVVRPTFCRRFRDISNRLSLSISLQYKVVSDWPVFSGILSQITIGESLFFFDVSVFILTITIKIT